jgi:hypothetical protein
MQKEQLPLVEAFDMIKIDGLPAQGNGQWLLHDSGVANTE